MKVLIAEDDVLIAIMLCEALKDGGYSVIGPAATYDSALKLCEHCAPDLAVLDINLLNGDKGTEIASEIFSRWNIKSIFASGESKEAWDSKKFAFGYIAKPYDPSLVLKSLEIAMLSLQGKPLPEIPYGLHWFCK